MWEGAYTLLPPSIRTYSFDTPINDAKKVTTK